MPLPEPLVAELIYDQMLYGTNGLEERMKAIMMNYVLKELGLASISGGE